MHPVLITKVAARHWRQSPAQVLLLIGILGLGVAAHLSIRLANAAALSGFQDFTGLVTRSSDWVLVPLAGALPEQILTELRTDPALDSVHLYPIVETTGSLPLQGQSTRLASGESFQVVGVDLISLANQTVVTGREEGNSRWGSTSADDPSDAEAGWMAMLKDPRSVFITRELGRRHQLRPGDSFRLVINASVTELKVAGWIPEPAGVPTPPRQLLVMDLPALQWITGRAGDVDRVEMSMENPAAPDRDRARVHSALERLGQDRWRVTNAAERTEGAAMMTRAFRLNLNILSLLALAVGLYLIYQALDGAVVRRRQEISILRSLGVTSKELRAAWLLESGLLGLLGGTLGVLGGWAGAQGAVQLVGRTVNALYHATHVEGASLSWNEALTGVGISVGAALVAGWIPARNAASTPPAQVLGNARAASVEVGLRWMRRAWLGWVFLGAGVALTPLPPWRWADGGRVAVAAYIAAACWILGAGILAGGVIQATARLACRYGVEAPVLRFAWSQLRNPSGRHRLAAASLVCAVAMTGGMAVLVSSFDQTMRHWIDNTFQADLYISSAGAQSASTENRIEPERWRRIVQSPEVREFNVMHVAKVRLGLAETMLVGSDLQFTRRHTHWNWVEKPRDDAVFHPAESEGWMLVSESFSDRFRVRRGDSIELPTPRGKHPLKIAGVFSDYGNERGSMVVDRERFLRWFGQEAASSLMLVTMPGADLEGLRTRLLAEHPGVQVLTQSALRSEVLRIFRETFAITKALEIIGVVVAVAGLGATLASILMERRSEWATLRAIGFTSRELASATALEGLLLATVSAAVGIGVSLGLGWLLIFVVNKQTFGWTLELALPIQQLGGLGGVVCAAGALTAYGMGRWSARLQSDREE